MKHLLAILLLATPAIAGKTILEKAPSCAAGVMVVQAEPDLLVVGRPVNVFFAQAQARKLLRELKCAAPCENVGRVRSKVDCRCYKKSRLP